MAYSWIRDEDRADVARLIALGYDVGKSFRGFYLTDAGTSPTPEEHQLIRTLMGRGWSIRKVSDYKPARFIPPR